MSSSARIIAVIATVAVLVVAFVVLSPGDDDEPASTTATQAAAPPPATTETTAEKPRAEPQPRYETVRVRAGKPVGGVERIRVTKGDRARIQVTTADTSDEIHLHGYDLTRDLMPGSRARFSFEADAEGIFEIELHGAGLQIAELVVEPR